MFKSVLESDIPLSIITTKRERLSREVWSHQLWAIGWETIKHLLIYTTILFLTLVHNWLFLFNLYLIFIFNLLRRSLWNLWLFFIHFILVILFILLNLINFVDFMGLIRRFYLIIFNIFFLFILRLRLIMFLLDIFWWWEYLLIGSWIKYDKRFLQIYLIILYHTIIIMLLNMLTKFFWCKVLHFHCKVFHFIILFFITFWNIVMFFLLRLLRLERRSWRTIIQK